MVTAPVELSEVRGLRQHDGPNRSTARGRASSLAPRCGSERCGSERSGKRGRVNLLCRLSRAREAQTEPHLANSGSRASVLVGSPADYGKLIADETEKWGKVIRSANIKPD
jgi:hypothetical protein